MLGLWPIMDGAAAAAFVHPVDSLVRRYHIYFSLIPIYSGISAVGRRKLEAGLVWQIGRPNGGGLDAGAKCIYNMSIRITWDEAKRSSNLKIHGFDFADAREVFGGPTFTFEDSRFSYAEERFVTLGMLRGFVVSIVHTETLRTIRVISFRKATNNEQAIFFKQIQD